MKKAKTANENQSSAEKGLSPGYMRKTFVTKIDQVSKLEIIAIMERHNMKVIIEDAFQLFIDAYEKKNGAIKLNEKK